MPAPKFLFGDVVVVNESQIGVVVKSWENMRHGCYYYDVYNRMTSKIEEYDEVMIERYRVRHKYLDEDELMYQNTW